MCDCIVLDEGRIAHYDETRRIHLHALVGATAFFDRCADRQRCVATPLRVGLQLCLIVCIIIGFGEVAFFRLNQRLDPDIRGAYPVWLESKRRCSAKKERPDIGQSLGNWTAA